MQDKLFKVLLILSAIVIPVIGGELFTPSPLTLPALSRSLDSGILSSLTTG